MNTVASNVKAFDVGFWSRYERTDTWVPNVASYFYHELHINQMRVMFQMTGTEVLARALNAGELRATSFESHARFRLQDCVCMSLSRKSNTNPIAGEKVRAVGL